MAEATVQMRGIRKQFPSCLANDNVDFTAYRGEIHALLGENGAGKSTLMSILTGVLQPDAGEICINGKPVMIRTPKDALQHGIGMIYQHFKLVKPFSVAENIVLGDDHVKVINKKKLEARVKALSERYCIEIDPGALTWQLSIGEQQRVEILKVLYRNANILILDEPTAVLTAQEVQELFLTLRKMTDSGCTVIFITHKMNEVMDYADRITILRDGCLVRTLTKAETDEKELAKLMVGREISMGRRNTTDTTTDRELLRVENLTVLNDKKLEAVRKLSFSLYAGEILGIAGCFRQRTKGADGGAVRPARRCRRDDHLQGEEYHENNGAPAHLRRAGVYSRGSLRLCLGARAERCGKREHQVLPFAGILQGRHRRL